MTKPIDHDEANQDRLLEATPDTATAVAPATDVPESLGALLDLHGSDAALDSRRWTSAAARRARQARIARDCHAGLAPLLALGAAGIAGADHLHLAVAVVAGTLGAAAIAASHRALAGGRPVAEAVAATAFAATLAGAVAVLPAESVPVGTIAIASGNLVAGVVALGAAFQVLASLSTKPVMQPRIARICAVVAAVGAVLAV